MSIAAGTAPGTTLRSSPVPNIPAYPGGIAVAAGHAINIVPSGSVAASTIRFTFHPATDLPEAQQGAAAPTVGNAFIAVLNEPTQTWIPLETHYDAATHELAATAPHFSVYQTFVLKPGKVLIHNALADISVIIKAGESGLHAAEAEGNAVWDAVKPEFGFSLRRKLPESARINATCSGGDPELPWDRRYTISVSDPGLKVRSCVVDPHGDQARPALLMENDYSYPVDVIPLQKGAALPGLTLGDHPDQDGMAALASLAGRGYIAGPGVTQIGLPAGQPHAFSVQVQANWLGLVTDVILTAAAIIPDFKATETKFSAELEDVITSEERAGQTVQSVTQTLKIVSEKLEAEKGPLFEDADKLTTVYVCASKLASIVTTGEISDLAGKLTGCLKGLIPSPGNNGPGTLGAAPEFGRYLDAVIGYIQLPSVLNDFREHGRQIFTIDASRVPTTSPTTPIGLGSGIYQVNRDFYDDGSLILALDRVQISQQGRAVFYVTYKNIGSSAQGLTCEGVSDPALAALTLADGEVINSVETYCSDHQDQQISVAPGQALTSYAIFPSTEWLAQPFSFSWSAGSLSGTVPGIKLESPTA